MQEMGIDESDISDVPTTSSKKQKAQKTDSSAPNNNQSTHPPTPTTAGPGNALVPEKKREKGFSLIFVII